MEIPQIVKINGKEYALIRASEPDGKEHQFLLPSDLSTDTLGRFVAVQGSAVTSPSPQAQTNQTSGYERSARGTPTSSVNAPGTNIWSQELSNWTPKLGTDLDSKWLQRIETDYMASQSQSAARHATHSSQQSLLSQQIMSSHQSMLSPQLVSSQQTMPSSQIVSSQQTMLSPQIVSSQQTMLSPQIVSSQQAMLSPQIVSSQQTMLSPQIVSSQQTMLSPQIVSSQQTMLSPQIVASHQMLPSQQIVSSHQTMPPQQIVSSHQTLPSQQIVSSKKIIQSQPCIPPRQIITSRQILSSQQALSKVKFPVFTKTGVSESKPKPTPIMLKPFVNIQPHTVVVGIPANTAGQLGTNKNVVMLAPGKVEGVASTGARVTGIVGNTGGHLGAVAAVSVGAGVIPEKSIYMPKSQAETRSATPVYKSKLEKAIAQSNMSNFQNTTASSTQKQPDVTLNQKHTEGTLNLNQTEQTLNQKKSEGGGNETLKRLLNSGVYRPQMMLTSNATFSSNQSAVTSSENLLGPVKDENVLHIEIAQPEDFPDPDITVKPETRKPTTAPSKKKLGKIPKTADQGMTTASGELYKKLVSLDKNQPPSAATARGNTKMFAIPTAALGKALKKKAADRSSSQSAGSSIVPPPLTQMSQPKSDSHVTPGDAGNQRVVRNRQGEGQVVEEMEYVDNTLARDILHGIWELRERDLLCDAVVMAGDNYVKLHKVVLAGVSPEMSERVADCIEPELRLLLPPDITHDNLMTFVSYLYHGRITLNVDNVQQLYRLSGVFHLEQLKKHCYNFCRLSKMGHLIISSPYQEAAKRVVEPAKPAVKRRRSQTPVKEKQIILQTKPLTSESAKPVNTPTAKKEVKADDFDWLTSDPSQSNMPIRKRGRNRRGLTNTVTTSASEIPPSISTTSNTTPPKQSPEILYLDNKKVSDNSEVVKVTPLKAVKPLKTAISEVPKKKAVAKEALKVKEHDPVIKERDPVVKEHDPVVKEHDLVVKECNPVVKKRDPVMKEHDPVVKEHEPVAKKHDLVVKEHEPVAKKHDLVVKEHEPVVKERDQVLKEGEAVVKERDQVEEVIQQLTELPDPLATGKFDESELLKIVPTEDDIVLQPETVQRKGKRVPAKTMVTRFRNRPKTMSVIEAAAQKKAKSNDTSSVYASKSPTKPKEKGKKPVNIPGSVKHPKGTEKTKSKVSPKMNRNISHELDTQLKSDTNAIDKPAAKQTTSEVHSAGELELLSNNHSIIQIKDVPKTVTDKVITTATADTLTVVSSAAQASAENSDAERALKRKLGDDNQASAAASNTTETMEPALAEKDVKIAASPPKKARQRKALVEQQQQQQQEVQESPKDTVYMRPPPKKRTKEIREMMKHEEDVIVEVKPTSAPEQDMPTLPANKYSYSVENDIRNITCTSIVYEDKKVIAKKPKKKVVKDDVMLQQVFDIELSGKVIDGEKQYRCHLCNNVFIFARRVVKHLVSTHDIQMEECRENVSVEPKSACPKVCDICGYQTKEVNIYYIHFHKYFRHGVPLPKGWQPFTCDLCKKEFFTKFQLREHKLIHFEENPFVCEHCGSGFKSRTCLNSHVFHKHSSVRKYVCKECPKTFKTRTQLKVHQRIHSGDKPFACPDTQCNYRSTTRGNMRLHLVNRHKFSNDYIKDVMNALLPSEAPHVVLETDMPEPDWHMPTAVTGAQERDLNEERAVEMASDPATLTTLVEAAVAEVNSAGGYHVSVLNEAQDGPDNGMAPVLSGVDNMATQMMDQDQGMNQTSRDYDINLVHPVQLVQNMNVMGHSEPDDAFASHMMVQTEADIQQSQDMMMRHQDQNTGALHNYHQNAGQQHTMALIPLQEYREPDHPSSSQDYGIPQDQRLEVGSHQVSQRPRIDPGSREARMIVKEVLQGHEPRSLLKAAIMQGTIDGSKLLRGTSECAKLTLDTRTLVGNHQLHSDFPEESTLVIDTHPEPQLVIAEEQVVHSVRMQDQFRGGHSDAAFRGDHLGEAAQHTDMDPSHLQSFQPSSMAPPPSYSGSSHGIISAIPVSDITVSHGLDQGQFQGEVVQTVSIQQSPVYGESALQQTGSQLNTDGNTYGGYYQQHFPIENH